MSASRTSLRQRAREILTGVLTGGGFLTLVERLLDQAARLETGKNLIRSMPQSVQTVVMALEWWWGPIIVVAALVLFATVYGQAERAEARRNAARPFNMQVRASSLRNRLAWGGVGFVLSCVVIGAAVMLSRDKTGTALVDTPSTTIQEIAPPSVPLPPPESSKVPDKRADAPAAPPPTPASDGPAKVTSMTWGKTTTRDNDPAGFPVLEVFLTNTSPETIGPIKVSIEDLRRRSEISGDYILVPLLGASGCQLIDHQDYLFSEQPYPFQIDFSAACDLNPTLAPGLWRIKLVYDNGITHVDAHFLYFEASEKGFKTLPKEPPFRRSLKR